MAVTAERDYARTWRLLGPEFEPSQTKRCYVCGLLHCRPYESDHERRLHQRRHRQVLRIYEPKPAPETFGTARSSRSSRGRAGAYAITSRAAP